MEIGLLHQKPPYCTIQHILQVLYNYANYMSAPRLRTTRTSSKLATHSSTIFFSFPSFIRFSLLHVVQALLHQSRENLDRARRSEDNNMHNSRLDQRLVVAFRYKKPRAGKCAVPDLGWSSLQATPPAAAAVKRPATTPNNNGEKGEKG